MIVEQPIGMKLADASWLIGHQVRSVFFVTLIPCALSHALCSACALVSAAVLGKLACLRFGVAILITRVIRLAPAECTGEYYRHPKWLSCCPKSPPLMQRSDHV
jgi:hypothetical protein